MQIEVLNIKGEKTGRSVELPDEIFNMEPNDHAIYLAVKEFQAAQRQGNAKVKGRSEVKGSSRKLHRQKGTGGSRKGNIRNPLYKGGGTVHGPQPHSFNIKVNRKVKDLAKISALSYKGKENAIFVIEDINMEKPSTKQVVDMFKSINLGDRKLLLVNLAYEQNLLLSTRNVPYINLSMLSDLNTYEILHADKLILTESAAKIFSENLEVSEA